MIVWTSIDNIRSVIKEIKSDNEIWKEILNNYYILFYTKILFTQFIAQSHSVFI